MGERKLNKGKSLEIEICSRQGVSSGLTGSKAWDIFRIFGFGV